MNAQTFADLPGNAPETIKLFSHLMAQCELLAAMAADSKAMLTVNHHHHHYDQDFAPLNGSVRGVYDDHLTSAFFELRELMGAKPFMLDWLEQKELELSQELEERAQGWGADRAILVGQRLTADKQRTLLIEKVQDATVALVEHLDRLLNQQVSHSERRGQIKDFKQHLQTALWDATHDPHDIPF
jgi:hypothetical protein